MSPRNVITTALALVTGMSVFSGYCAYAKKTNLRMVINSEQIDVNAFKEVVSRYQKSHPGVTITLEAIPWDEYPSKITLMISAGVSPDLAYCWPAKGFLQWYGGGMLADLEQLDRQDKSFDAGVLSSSALTDQTYPGGGFLGLPMDIAYTTIIYNKTYLANAGLIEPYDIQEKGEWNLDAFLATAKALTKDANGDGKFETYGFAANPTWEGYYLSALWANQADVVTRDRRTCTLDTPDAVQAIDLFMRKLIYEYKVSPPNAAAFGPGFGMAVMHQSGLEALKVAAEKGKYSYDYALFPKVKSSASRVSTGGISIFKRTKNLAGAWSFSRYLLSEETMMLRADMTGRIPTRPNLMSQYARTMPMAKGSGLHLTDVLKACIPIAKPTPYTPNYKDWYDLISTQYFTKLISGKATAAQLAPSITKQANTILSRTKWRYTAKK